MRGQFQRADGLILPNNITQTGAQFILGLAFRRDLAGDTTSAPTSLSIGLCKGSPTPTLLLNQIEEPTLAMNGYLRQSLAPMSSNWPDVGLIGGQRYVQSKWVTFAATGAGFNKPINRLFLTPATVADSDFTKNVYAISAPLPADLNITPATPEINRTFRYQIFI